MRWLGHLFQMPPRRIPWEVFREAQGKTQEPLEKVSSQRREVWASLLRLLSLRPGPGLTLNTSAHLRFAMFCTGG